jgi:hypothetical protein
MKYFLSFIALFLWSCVPSTVAVDRQSEELNKKIITLQTSNLSLKEKETAYRNMITEGQIGLRNLTQQERDDEIASARKTALYCSLFSILGVVAAAILFYLRSTIFAMIMLVGSGGLFAGCIIYASVIQYAGHTLAGILGLLGVGFLGYEAWKHRAAFNWTEAEKTVSSINPLKNPPAPVQRLIQRKRVEATKRLGRLAAKVASSLPSDSQKVG